MSLKQKIHSYPLTHELGKFGQLLNLICNDIPNFRPIPTYAKEGAKHILLSVFNRYPTQGRRLEVFVIVALGIARGDKNPNDLQDLAHRVEYILGKGIPLGQVRNTFNELRTFLKYHRQYEWRSCNQGRIFTLEERKILSILKLREKIPRK